MKLAASQQFANQQFTSQPVAATNGSRRIRFRSTVRMGWMMEFVFAESKRHAGAPSLWLQSFGGGSLLNLA
ncbi:MAG: hypothetical protein AB8H80_13410 [Planctomycetota bacterium]